MSEKDFVNMCKFEITKYYLESEGTNVKPDEIDDNIYVVWLCKILQNNKELLSTNYPDGLYFECTYNGDKDELYLDVYKRQKNMEIKYD